MEEARDYAQNRLALVFLYVFLQSFVELLSFATLQDSVYSLLGYGSL